jgi:SAM-dependent methyltransferase
LQRASRGDVRLAHKFMTHETHIYYVFGVTASGKTQVGRELAYLMKGCCLESDLVYRAMQWTLNSEFPTVDLGQIVDRAIYNSLRPNIAARAAVLKERLYAALWPGGKLDRVCVIEGGCCTFPDDRKAIAKAIGGPFKETFLLLDPPIEDWIRDVADKYTTNKEAMLAKKDDWAKIYQNFKNQLEVPAGTYSFSNPGEILLNDPQDYQRQGFTDEKWRCLHMPDNLEGISTLDLGCNAGWMGHYCFERGATKVVGLDLHWRALEQARERGVDARRMDLDQLCLPGEEFDYTLLLSSVQYVKEPEPLIAKISRMTRKVFVLECPTAQNGQDWEIPPNGPNFGRYPSCRLIEMWLAKYFQSFELIGPSVRPDNFSTRFVWKAYMDEQTLWRNRWDGAAQERHIQAIAAVEGVLNYQITGILDSARLLRDLVKLFNGFLFTELCVLEHGCGAGRMTVTLAPFFREYHCTDWSDNMLLKANVAAGTCPTSYHVCLASILPHASASMDIVFSYTVLMHNRKATVFEIMKEYFRVLKPGGRALFQLPSYKTGCEAADYNQVSIWTLDEMHQLAQDSGFEPIRISHCPRSMGSQISDEHFDYHIFRKPAES